MFDEKVIAITGGTGSFGRHVVRLFLTTNARAAVRGPLPRRYPAMPR